jgi:hypothetical protein
MLYGMKERLFLAVLLIIPVLCFAQYYAEYSFDEAKKIDFEDTGVVDFKVYSFNFFMTKADIQEHINRHSKNDNDIGVNADHMSRMLKASANKCIFYFGGKWSEYLFIKINENGYLVFFSGL